MNVGELVNKEDKVLMEKYDITSASKTVYFYKEFKYETLDRAVRYAEHEEKKLASEALNAVSL